MENINIEDYKDYKDYENVTIAEFVAAIRNAENLAVKAVKKGDLKTAKHYVKIYFELNKLYSKKIKNGSGLGYKPKGNSK